MTTSLHKIRIYACLLFAAYFLLATFIPGLVDYSRLYAQDDEIYIENPASYSSKSRPAVYFPHERLIEAIDCLDCHHDYQDGKNILDEDDLDDDGSAKCAQAQCHAAGTSIETKTAYHRQCMGCHRRTNKQEAASLPITCKDCHNRRSPQP